MNNSRRWRKIVVESIVQGYDHKKRWDLIKDVKDTIKAPEGKMLVKEAYGNDHRTKATTLNGWKHQSNSIQKIDCHEGPRVNSVYLNNVEMNGVEVNIVSQIVQLLLNSFKAQSHPQKDVKRRLITRNCEFRKPIARVQQNLGACYPRCYS